MGKKSVDQISGWQRNVVRSVLWIDAIGILAGGAVSHQLGGFRGIITYWAASLLFVGISLAFEIRWAREDKRTAA